MVESPASKKKYQVILQDWLWLRIAVHMGALLPLAVLVVDAGLHHLGADPIRASILRTGKTALVLLTLSLACTPLNTIFGFKPALKVRRALGLYASLYVLVHLFLFVGVDYGFDWKLLWGALDEKTYALVGLAAGITMLPLALTSFKAWQIRLGRKWKYLHRLVYLASLLAAVHYILLVKPGVAAPYYWLAGIAALLLTRIPPLQRMISGLRQQPRLLNK